MGPDAPLRISIVDLEEPMSPVMLEPPGGFSTFRRLVLDYTGTLSEDGILLPGVEERLRRLASELAISVVTADTFGTVKREVEHLPVEVQVIS